MADEEEDDVNTDEPEEAAEVEAETNEDANADKNDEDEEDDEQKEGEEGEEEEETEKVIPKPLTLAIMQKCLAMLCKTSSGLHHAFVKFDCRNQEITDIELLQNYPHLRYIDVSRNLITDVAPLKHISQILLLNCDHNKLTEFQLDKAEFLRVLSLAGNQLETCANFQDNFPMLEQLILNFNQLPAVDLAAENSSKLCHLHTLELRGNQLTSTKGLRLPNLKNLYLAQNKLERLEDISCNTGLKTLHLRENRLTKLAGFTAEMVNLEYINLRQNQIEKGSQLRKLQCLPHLTALSLGENPISAEDDYRIQVAAYLPKLSKIDKDSIDEDSRVEAEAFVAEGKLEEEEEEPDPSAAAPANEDEDEQQQPTAETTEGGADEEMEEEEENE